MCGKGVQFVRVIFLDIDGVLNRRADWNRLYSLNDACIRSFLAFAKKRHASVVLTSSWRNGFDVKVPENSSEPVRRLLKKLEAGGVCVTDCSRGFVNDRKIKFVRRR